MTSRWPSANTTRIAFVDTLLWYHKSCSYRNIHARLICDAAYQNEPTMSSEWKPASIETILDMISTAEAEMDFNELRLWDTIRMELGKWTDGKYGTTGGGFWTVAIIGKHVLWYNDIEDGWNVSTWTTFGKINEYWCNQVDLRSAMGRITYLLNEARIR